MKAAKDYDCAIRIGVNAGSLDKNILEKFKEPCPEALIESAEQNIKLLEDNDFLVTLLILRQDRNPMSAPACSNSLICFMVAT